MFRYRDRVKVKEGFYRGYEGTLIDYEYIRTEPHHSYRIKILTQVSRILPVCETIVSLPEEYLEKIEE